MPSRQEFAEFLLGHRSTAHRARRQAVGFGVAAGFFASLVGFAMTGSSWWLLCLPAGTCLAWRLVVGRWPFFPPRQE